MSDTSGRSVNVSQHPVACDHPPLAHTSSWSSVTLITLYASNSVIIKELTVNRGKVIFLQHVCLVSVLPTVNNSQLSLCIEKLSSQPPMFALYLADRQLFHVRLPAVVRRNTVVLHLRKL